MNNDSRLRIREAKRRRSKHLDLSALELMAVPAELFELSFLQTLSLSGNCISRLDERLAMLSELRELDLSANLFESLPRCVGLLPHLEKLNVARNPLKPELDFLASDTDFSRNRAQFLSGFEASDKLFQKELSNSITSTHNINPFRIPNELQTDIENVQVGAQVAQGGFAVVHKAEFFGSDVAIKLFTGGRSSSAETDFVSELNALAALRHPVIVSLLGFGTSPDRFLLLELVDGPSLHVALHVRRISLNKLKILQALAAALAFVHSRRLVHRDLTPRNVLLTSQGQVKLIDFGLCRSADQLERQRSIVTPAYAAPELFGQGHLSEKVDVWSFGVLLWEVASERTPVAGLSASDIRRTLVSGQFPAQLSCAQISSAVTDIVHRCLHADPTIRPFMREVAADLDRLKDI